MFLTLFFLCPICCFPPASWAAEPTAAFEASLAEYAAKMLLALVLLAAAGWAMVKYLPGRFRIGMQGKLRLLGALSLGRDVFYLVRVGPDVVALVTGRAGTTVVGRWSAEDWDDYEAAASRVDRAEDLR